MGLFHGVSGVTDRVATMQGTILASLLLAMQQRGLLLQVIRLILMPALHIFHCR